MMQPAAVIRLASLVLLSTLTPWAASAATWTAFGPEVVVRRTGKPTPVIRTFSVLNPDAVYVLQVEGTSAGKPPHGALEIVLNGRRVTLGPVSSSLPVPGWPVRLNLTNQLVIELRGAPGAALSVKIVGVDTDPPTISGTIAPVPAASGWLKTGAVVSFVCADATSGIASCTSPVPVNTEGANQVVTGTAIDKAGHQSTTSVSVSIDRTAPTIEATLTPQPNAGGWTNSPVTVTFACTDALSGVLSCPAATTVSTPGSHTVTAVATDRAGNQTSLATTVKVASSVFTLRNYGGKCLDAGPLPQPGGGLYLKTCNGSAGQQFRIEEMNASHQVRLHAGATVVGFTYDPAPVIDDGSSGGGSGVSEGPLVLQVPANPAALGLSNQLFALDGDSIIAAIDKTLVAQVENARGADGSPVVLRTRRLADAEFWDVAAIDGADARPTSGFVRVDTVCQLLRHLRLKVPGQPPDGCPQAPFTPAGPGTVIEIASGAVLDFAGLYPVQLPSGVTLRGGRRGLDPGARFCKALDCDEDNPMDAPDGAMLEVTGSDVRITGLRLEGPSRRTDPGVQTTRAVLAHDGPATTRTIVDHNDVSGWTGGGIDVLGPDDNDMTGCTLEPPSFSHVLVARNFLHHNRQQEKGYGVVTGKGGFPFIEGNTFLANRHAIAAAGGGHTGYFARFNLVLSEVPLQDGPGPINWRTHDFDQHGNGDNGFGGRAGLYNWIFNNTFLGANRANYEIRGHPCRKVDFGRNVSLQGSDDAVVFEPYMILPTQPASEVVNFIVNRFDSQHPANRLGVGDFDGDGVDDLFLATGAAWYFSAAGAREWRYLSGNEPPLSFLRFGDVDGDGRTDVLGVSGGKILVSWGGASTFEVLNDAPAAGAFITDFAVGEFVSDFPGDRRDDLFYANGASWFVSSGGSSTFLEVNTSSKRIAELRFGDFNGNGLTDVMAIESGVWKVSYDAVSTWTALAVSLTDSVDTLMVADFDADGHADIGMITDRDVPGTFGPTTSVFSWTFSISQGGGTSWVSRTITPTSSCALTFKSSYLAQAGLIAGIGNVDGIAGADVVAWGAKDGNNFCVISSGIGAAARQSSQDMR